MNFQQAIATCFRKYATFTGRASRAEYWYWVLLYLLVSAALAVLDRALFGVGAVGHPVSLWMMGYPMGTLGSIWGLAAVIPTIAVATRRLHDTDRSGWFQLLLLIPLFGMIILLIWYCQKGTGLVNRFGATPTLIG